MNSNFSFPLGLLACFLPLSSFAETHIEPANQDQIWLDDTHNTVKSTLHSWVNEMDNWFGTPDPNEPATANLRIMLDNRWNKYDGYSLKPRVRGKIKLPVLKKRFSLVFGDDSIDNELQETHLNSSLVRNDGDNKRFDRRQSRQDNSSVALRWSNGIKKLGVDTDLDLGIRSGDDVYLRFKANKEWQLTHNFSTRFEQIYRYGINSKHYARSNLEIKHQTSERMFSANSLYLQYTNDLTEEVSWGNSLYQERYFSGNKRLTYGLFVGGNIQHKKPDLNTYGPFISWRQPVFRQWLFIQPELNYYNDRKKDRKHTISTFVRLEALF